MNVGGTEMIPILPCSGLLLAMSFVMDPTTDNESPAGDRAASGAYSEQLITDFTSASPDLGWYVVNDNVMGGRSEGSFEVAQGQLRFAGRTNTDGGGFSSIRSEPLAQDLSAYEGIRVRVMGDGRRYTWRLTTHARVYGRPVAYWADFDTVADAWQTIDIPFSGFVPRFRGTTLDGPPLDTREITGMGLMIYDKRDGPFELRLRSIHAFAEVSSFSLDRWKWEKRLLVISAPGVDDPRLMEQLDALDASRSGFVERDMLLVTLLDDTNSQAADQRLTSEEVGQAREQLGILPGDFAVRLIGKDGGVNLSQGTFVPMEEVYALIDGMPMRQREMKARAPE